jgi:acetyltransferase-like isoleucine patch superfamily enzyme
MSAAHRRFEAVPLPAVAPPSAPPRTPGWRDRLRARRARQHGVAADGPVALGRGVRFEVAPGARVVLGAGVVLGDGCRFHLAAGEVSIGAGTVLGERCVVTAHERIAIGAGCLLADEVVLSDFAPRHEDVERPVRLQGLATAPVRVGDGARIGPGAAVLCGVTIGARAVVGAHAVVTRDVPDAAVVEGVPAAPTTSRRPSRPARGGGAPR